MLSKESLIIPADNCGVYSVKIFHIYGGFKKQYCRVGTFFKGSIYYLNPEIIKKKKSKVVGICIRLKQRFFKLDGSTLTFKINNCILLKKRTTPLGGEFVGPVHYELGRKKIQLACSGIL